ncbi:Vacuolar iron transporter 1 [Seminavis robusta]|uniref:Vacuolar iron transporter 1 n=1 Tax=Seminavis robusta TaxID=568900 RepID=A0A9N8D4Q5_9STRA|nr:Vacuolar iron transporter 1 [Seminavis robusta]|eukprot:Sro1_g000080.1 Vacuolar iron transporter 1 (289) ;mRNA; r:25225-26213
MATEETKLLADDNGTRRASLTARQAFEGADASASRAYHESKGQSDEAHQSEGGLLKPIIFGGLDGILTSFAIVAGSAGGNLSPNIVLVLGFSNIFADALAMGVGEFLSSKANNEWIMSERARENWEMENFPEGEIAEMIDIYKERGMGAADAEMVVKTMSKYKDFFVDIMMSQELQLQVPEEDHVTESMKEGFVMFCSFAFFGALPLLGYVIIPSMYPELGEHELFVTACVVTGCVLFLMGSIKSFFCSQHWLKSGLETFFLGGACATVAFTVGQFVDQLIGDDAPDL